MATDPTTGLPAKLAGAGKSGLRSLPRTVWALGAVSLLTDAASDMIYPLLPEILAKVGATAVALGVMEGVAELFSSVVKLWAGRVADKGTSSKLMVVAGYTITSLARPLLAFAHHAYLVVGLRSVDRIGKGIRGVPRDAILAEAVPAHQRGLAFGVHRGMDNMGAFVGGLLAFLLLGAAHLPLDVVVMLSIVPGILSTAVAIFFVDDRKEKPVQLTLPRASETGETKARAVTKVPLGGAVVRALVAMSVFGITASADSFLMAHLTRLGLALEWIPLAWISLQLSKSLLNVPGGALADRIGPKRVAALSYAVYAGAYALFAVVTSPTVFWLLLPLYALYYGFGEGAEKALLVALSPREARGRTLGMNSALTGACLFVANVGFGLVYVYNPTIAFVGTSIIAAVATVLMVVLVPAPTDES